MNSDEAIRIVERLARAFSDGDLDVVDELLLADFYSYLPRPGEQNAQEVFRQLGADLLAALPDLSVTLSDLTVEEEEVRGKLHVGGHFSGQFWRIQGTGEVYTLEAEFAARLEEGRAALRFFNLNLVPLLREMKIIATAENAHLRLDPHPAIPEIFYRLLFNRMALEEKPCSHLGLIQFTEPATDLCAQCVASGDEWPALRMCLQCGFVGCCDLSVNKHMKQHCETTGHTLIRSIVPGERWIWCYEDRAILASWHLDQV